MKFFDEHPRQNPEADLSASLSDESDYAGWPREAASRLMDTAKCLDEGASYDQFSYIHLTNLYLLASYLYYTEMYSMMDDATFDGLCGYLRDHYDELALAGVYGVGTLIEREALESGTGYHLVRKMPIAIQQIAYYVRAGA